MNALGSLVSHIKTHCVQNEMNLMIINHLFLVLPKGTLGNSVDPEQTPQNATAHINILNFCKIIQIKINQKPLNDKYVRSFWKDRRIKLIEPPHDKPTKRHVRPAKTQISLGIRPAWPESSLCAQWVAKDLSFLNEDSENSDQTERMPRLIWVFAGRTCHFVGFVVRRLKCRFFPFLLQEWRWTVQYVLSLLKWAGLNLSVQ